MPGVDECAVVDHWLLRQLQAQGNRTAIVWQGEYWSYGRLSQAVSERLADLQRQSVVPGSTLAIVGDYAPHTCVLLLAALINRNIVVPISSAPPSAFEKMLAIGEVQWCATFDADATCRLTLSGSKPRNGLLRTLIARGAPGLVLFSSGSTGESKASVLDMDKMLAKFSDDRQGQHTLVFLAIDHIGGINTLFHVLCHGGAVVTPLDRSPDAVCAAIAAHSAELLPTTPTFLNMLLISNAIGRHDLSSLRTITYGAEPMPPSTLGALRAALPACG